MPFKSLYPDIDIPQSNLLTNIFGNSDGSDLSDEPIWLNNKDPSKNLSLKQCLQYIKRLGCGLEQLGLQRQDVVVMCSPNHIFVPVAYLGLIGAGYIFSGVNPVYTASEMAHQLSNTAASIILAHPSVLETVLEAAAKVDIPKESIYQFADEPSPVQSGVQDWNSLLASPDHSESWQWPELSPEEATTTIASINYSSGTTGLPKGVCVSHANLIANSIQAKYIRSAHTPYAAAPDGSRSQKPPAERWIGFLPLYHAFGQLYIIILTAQLKIPAYIMSAFNFEDFLSTIGKYKITNLQVPPPVIVMLCKRPEPARYDLSSLNHTVCAAAPLSRELQQTFEKRFGARLSQAWGLTELTCKGTHVPEALDGYAGSVGRLLPNCECKLVDDDGKEAAAGGSGEIYIRGPNVSMGYWRNEAATKDLIDADGWLKTGDVATCNEEGYFFIVDRKKELIKVNGLQVAPAELEAALLENEHVADAAVVQIKVDDEERPRAYIVIQESSQDEVSPKDIEDWIASRVSKHKRLTGGVVFIKAVPRLASGKIVRKQMREWAQRDAAELPRGSMNAEG